MFRHSDDDFIFTTSWKNSPLVQSEFDKKLMALWKEREDKGLFRYTYKVESIIELPGKYRFPAVVSFHTIFDYDKR